MTTLTDDRLREILAGCEGVQGGPWKLDKFARYIWAPSEKGGDFPLMDEPGENGRVAELRGWGYYTGNGHGALGLHPDEASKRQRLTGEHVARLDPATVTELCRLALIGLEAERRSTGDTVEGGDAQALTAMRAELDEARKERDAAYDRGQRDILNALLELNPKAAQKRHIINGGTEEAFTNHEGKLPFDVVFWVCEVAAQLGIRSKEEMADDPVE